MSKQLYDPQMVFCTEYVYGDLGEGLSWFVGQYDATSEWYAQVVVRGPVTASGVTPVLSVRVDSRRAAILALSEFAHALVSAGEQLRSSSEKLPLD